MPDSDSPVIDAAAAALDAVGADAIELAQLLLRVDTSNPPGNETAAARVLQEWLAARGVDSELIGPDPDRQNLVATLDGRGDAPSLAMCGHLDVVPAGELDAWVRDPFGGDIVDGMLWGRGAVDMKVQVATRAAALAALARAGVQPAGTVRLIAQADEEVNSGGIGMAWLVKERRDLRCDWALEEGGGRTVALPDGRAAVLVGVADKALVPITIHARGSGGHGCNPGLVHNPVGTLATLMAAVAAAPIERRLVPSAERMLRVMCGDAVPDGAGVDELVIAAWQAIPDMAATVDAVTRTTLTPTMLHGSQSVNVIPDHAWARFDCRVLPGVDAATEVARLDAVLRQVDVGDAAWEIEPATPIGGSACEPDAAFSTACADALARVGLGEGGASGQPVILPTVNPFYTDAGHLRREWGTVAYGLWPWRFTDPVTYNTGVHAPNERIDVRDVDLAARWHLELLLGMSRAAG